MMFLSPCAVVAHSKATAQNCLVVAVHIVGKTRLGHEGNLIFNTVFNNPSVVQTPQVAANNLANLPSLSGTNTLSCTKKSGEGASM